MNSVFRGFRLSSVLKGSILITPRNSLSTTSYCFAALATKPDSGSSKDVFAAQLTSMEQSVKAYKEYVNSRAAGLKNMHDIYYGKERDVVNFPTFRKPETQPKVRLGFIPDAFFQAFYNKNGVIGPYIFFIGGPLFLISKEFWVPDHEFFELLPFVVYIMILWRLLGAKMGKYMLDGDEKYDKLFYHYPLKMEKDIANKIKEALVNEEKRKEIGMQTFQAKKEILDLQLEAVYRNRLIEAHKAVKSRLDYLVEKENTKRRFQQEYMVNWIIDAVKKEITPQKQKETLQSCIADLKALAQKNVSTA